MLLGEKDYIMTKFTMKFTTAVAVTVLGLSVITGCEEEKTPAPSVGTGPMKGATDAARDVAGKVSDKAASATETVSVTGEKVADDVKDATSTAGDNVKDAAGTASDAIVRQAEELYNKAKAAIENGRLDEAKPMLEKLTALKDKLPADWQKKVADLVELAKTKGSDAIKSLTPGAN